MQKSQSQGPRIAAQILLALAIVMAAGGVIFCITYLSKVGQPIDKYLDSTVLDDTNPARVRIAVENSNIVSLKHVDIGVVWDDVVVGQLNGREDTIVAVYLPLKEIAKLEIGDNITVRGKVKYSGFENGQHKIIVGDAIQNGLFSFPAQIISINN